MKKDGVVYHAYFTVGGVDPYEAVEWARRDAIITSADGEPVFQQEDVEAPLFWSKNAVSIVASKYFKNGEYSVRQLISRVVDTIASSGEKQGYFLNGDYKEAFSNDLAFLLLNQYGSFNSPVWFNVGVSDKPQSSACFILSLEDSMDSIMDLAKKEARIFKWGSGCGTNLSVLRSSKETVKGGGYASGPVSFMRGYDSFAGIIKSGGIVRRAAKMQILDAMHPDIMDFITCKPVEERKAKDLIAAGWDGSLNGEAYSSVAFQNLNLSVRVNDDFMRAVEADEKWKLKSVKTGEDIGEVSARELMRAMAKAAWECGDPGIQYDNSIQLMNPCKSSGRINAQNPCSEYAFLDDTACNLASLNLMKFYDGEASKFNAEGFIRAVETFILAMDIIVDMSSYPDPKITENSHRYRPLGLGYGNLGGLLMLMGLPYDSDEGREVCSDITALMTFSAYRFSSYLAECMGAYPGLSFGDNKEHHWKVLKKHQTTWGKSPVCSVPIEIGDLPEKASCNYSIHGLRNAQVTLLAPTGTIGFMMDFATTGIEPELNLVKYKDMVDGGRVRIVNPLVGKSLKRLGYEDEVIQEVEKYIEENDTISGCDSLKDEHLSIFDCSLPSFVGGRVISPEGHLKMLAAAQPFLSGGISKTINVPESATVEDIEDIFKEGWKLGLKCVAVYRDNCKAVQPYSLKKNGPRDLGVAARKRLPDDRNSVTRRFVIHDGVAGGNHKGYITVGLYENGRPGEIFIKMAKQGSTVCGLVDGFATVVSIALQYGVPLKTMVSKICDTRFPPYGFTESDDIKIVSSILDYVGRFLRAKFLNGEETSKLEVSENAKRDGGFGPACPNCGNISIRDGKCFICVNCGTPIGSCTG